MGLAISLLQGGIVVAYIAFSLIMSILPSSFKVPRVGHTTLTFAIMGAAHVLGLPYFLDKLDKVHAYGQLSSIDLHNGCASDHLHDCQAAQVVYRASSVLFLYFILMAAAGGAVHFIYAKLWSIKFLAVAGGLVGFLFLPEPGLFGVYADVARVLSLLWLMFQGFLVLDFAHDLHDFIGAKAEEHDDVSGSSGSIFSSWWRILYLLISLACLVASGLGLAALFTSHAGCALGATISGITLAAGLLAIVCSLLESVGIGLLPPSVLFAHSVFLGWYAMSSHPDSTCNPWAEHDVSASSGKTLGIIISIVLLVSTVGWCTWHGEKLLGIFGVDSEESASLLTGGPTVNYSEVRRKKRVKRRKTSLKSSRQARQLATERQESDDEVVESRPSRVFYCLVMACASAFAAMAMTSWARTDGSPESAGGRGTPLESVWLKIVAQWLAILLQMRVIWVAFRDNRDGSSYRSF